MHADVHSSQAGIGDCFGYEWRPHISVPLTTLTLMSPALIPEACTSHPRSCGYLDILGTVLSTLILK